MSSVRIPDYEDQIEKFRIEKERNDAKCEDIKAMYNILRDDHTGLAQRPCQSNRDPDRTGNT